MSTVRIDTVFNIELEFELAPLPRRLVAYLIDFMIMVMYMLAMKLVLYGSTSDYQDDSIGMDILLISFPMLIYSLFTEVLLNGQTIGKKAMGIRVVSLEGGEPSIGQYTLRWITKFFEWPFLFAFVVMSQQNTIAYATITGFCGIGVVVAILTSSRSQRLGDLAAGTVVVSTKTSMGLNDTVFVELAEDYKVTYPQVMRLSDNDINTIKNILGKGGRKHYDALHERVAYKVYEVLNIPSTADHRSFLEKLLLDYNYLATREKS